MSRECAISLDNLPKTIFRFRSAAQRIRFRLLAPLRLRVPKALLVEAITELGPKRIDELCRALSAASGC
jgi:hypothetical protein